MNEDRSGGSRWKLWIPAVLLTFAGFGAAWVFMEPAPPNELVIVTGRADGAYHAFGEKYAEHLARQGITLEVRETAGSLENYRLLTTDSEVHLAIVQGGTAPPAIVAADDIESLTGLYLEPVWLFARSEVDCRDVRDLAGRTVAIGGAGSGTRAIAEELLDVNEIRADDGGTAFSDAGGNEAAAKLIAGEVDAAFFVISASSPIVRGLLASDNVELVGIERNEAYRRRLPYLSAVTLPQGVVDFEKNLPDRDVPMIAPVAQLVATESLHDAFVPLLMEAVRDVNGPGDLLTEPGMFPSLDRSEFPANASAKNWLRNGTSFLYRWLPFWVASAIDRGKILLLPAITLLLPLVKVFPPVIRWRIRSSIYKWYADLRDVDQSLRESPSAAKTAKLLERVAAMQKELNDISVPLSYMEEFYNLRLHIDLVRRSLVEHAAATAAETEADEGDSPPRVTSSSRIA